ncbi:transglycosylase SLT domain-containing protein [Methylobacterium sp. JK268]
MQHRAIGPSAQAVRWAPAGPRDALLLGGPDRSTRGGLPVLARTALTAACLAAGLGSLLHRYGPDLATSARPQVTLMADLLTMPMPKPRVQERPKEVPISMPVHDLDTALGADGVDRVSYDDLISATMGGDPNEILTFGPMRIRRHIVQTVVKAAYQVGMDPVLLMAIADKESSFITEVQARTSSATGLYQFIERTWLQVMREFGALHGCAREAALIADDNSVGDAAEKARILDMRRDPALSAVLAAEMLKRDSARIAARIGRTLTLGETYLAHFLGPDDAERFMAKVVEEPKAEAAALLPKPARANKPIFYERVGRRKARSLSVAQVHDKFEAMMTTRGDRYRDVGALMGVMAYAAAQSP